MQDSINYIAIETAIAVDSIQRWLCQKSEDIEIIRGT